MGLWSSVKSAFSGGLDTIKGVGGSKGALGLNDSYGALSDPIGFLTGENQANAQNAQQLEWWNMQNDYNTPKAQMARFAEAGLNPNLIYTQNNTAGSIGTAASAPSGAQTLGKVASTVASIYGLKGIAADIANKKAMNSNIYTQNGLLETQTAYTRGQADQLVKQGQLIDAQRNRMEAETDRYKYETEWLKNHGTTSFEDPQIRGLKGNIGEINDKLSDVLSEHLGGSSIDKPEVSTQYRDSEGHKVLVQRGSNVDRPPKGDAVVTKTNTGQYVYRYPNGNRLIYIVK